MRDRNGVRPLVYTRACMVGVDVENYGAEPGREGGLIMYPGPPSGLGSPRRHSTCQTPRLPDSRTDRGVGWVFPLLGFGPARELPRSRGAY